MRHHETFLSIMTFALVLAWGGKGRAAESSPPLDLNDVSIDSPFVKDGKFDVEAAVKYFEDLYRSTSSISEVRMQITNPRAKRTMEMKIWTLGQEKSLILLKSPARNRGAATLKVDNNLWNYLPNTKRTYRIPPSLMLSSWMGSDFTNDDLVREASFSQDYTYQLVGRAEDPAGWLIRFDAKPNVVGLWNRIDLTLSDDATQPLKADHYDRKDRLSRTIIWSDIRKFGAKEIPATMTLTPQDKKGYRTEMTYTAIDFNVEVPERYFSLAHLEKLR